MKYTPARSTAVNEYEDNVLAIISQKHIVSSIIRKTAVKYILSSSHVEFANRS